jgi:hypothetical protein
MRGRGFGVVVAAVVSAMSGCGGSPQSLADGAGESPGQSLATPPSGAGTGTAAAATEAATVCVQGTLRGCLGQLPTQGTVHNCFAGKQLCSGGTWTACQDPAALVGVRTQRFVAACPSGSSVQWTTLDYVVDAPSNVSGASAATVGIAGHPDVVLLDTQSSDGVSAKVGAGSRTIESILGALSELPGLTLEIATTTTPDGSMAATVKAELGYTCSSGSAR